MYIYSLTGPDFDRVGNVIATTVPDWTGRMAEHVFPDEETAKKVMDALTAQWSRGECCDIKKAIVEAFQK
jgi:hypothetical protein